MKTKIIKYFSINVMLLLLMSMLIGSCCKQDKLLDHTWVLERYGTENSLQTVLDASQLPHPAKSEIILQLKTDKQFTGNDGCNSIFGEFELKRRCKIKFGQITSTLMMCQGNVMNQAGSIKDLLKRSEKYKVTTRHLKLYTANGELLIYKRKN